MVSSSDNNAESKSSSTENDDEDGLLVAVFSSSELFLLSFISLSIARARKFNGFRCATFPLKISQICSAARYIHTHKSVSASKKNRRTGVPMARGGKKTHQLEDQYGGFDAASGNDDRSGGFNASHGFGGGFKGGGGGAGGGKGPNLKYERVVPKFLQKHADLLVGNTIVARKEEEAVELRFGDEEDVGRRGLGSRATTTTTMSGKNANITNNNSTHNGDRDAEESIEERCLELKGKGNRCFQNGEYEQAVDLFTKCIVLRQGKTGSGAEEDNTHIYYSNRSAAYVKLGQFELAKRDALESIERSRGQWAKGWVRLAVVSLALDDLTTHAKAYARAYKLDPLNDDLKEKMDKAQDQERKAMENGLFKFKASSLKASSEGAKKENGGTKRKNRIDGNSKEKKKSKNKSEVGVLSFNEEEGEEEEEH